MGECMPMQVKTISLWGIYGIDFYLILMLSYTITFKIK